MSELARIEAEKTNDGLLQALGEAWDNASELRTEIARLKEENFRYSETQTKLNWAKETNVKLYAEIEELKSRLVAWKENSDEWQQQSEERGKLIKELCDALDRYTPDVEGGYREAKELIQRARKDIE